MMKRIRWIAFTTLIVLSLSLLILSPLGIQPVSASVIKNGFAQSGTVIASANVVPTQVTHLSFTISGRVKEVLVSKGDKVTAGQTLITLDSTELETAVQLATANREVTFAQWEYQLQPRRSQLPEDRVFAKARLDQSDAQIEIAKLRLAEATLLSPIDATVISVDVKPGETVDVAQVVVTIATLDKLQVETKDLSERDVTRVQVGQKATVSVDALKEEFTGKVTAISPIWNTIGGDVVFKVTIALDEQPAGLLWGMSTEVTISE
jgi:RND family efflux transporter MFP subunit